MEDNIGNDAVSQNLKMLDWIEFMQIKYKKSLLESMTYIKYDLMSVMLNNDDLTDDTKLKILIKMLSLGWPFSYGEKYTVSHAIKFHAAQLVELLKHLDEALNNQVVTKDHYMTFNILTENILTRITPTTVMKEEALHIRHKYNLGFDCLYEPHINELVFNNEELVNKLLGYGFRIGEFSICAKRLSDLKEQWALDVLEKLKKGSADDN